MQKADVAGILYRTSAQTNGGKQAAGDQGSKVASLLPIRSFI